MHNTLELPPKLVFKRDDEGGYGCYLDNEQYRLTVLIFPATRHSGWDYAIELTLKHSGPLCPNIEACAFPYPRDDPQGPRQTVDGQFVPCALCNTQAWEDYRETEFAGDTLRAAAAATKQALRDAGRKLRSPDITALATLDWRRKAHG